MKERLILIIGGILIALGIVGGVWIWRGWHTFPTAMYTGAVVLRTPVEYDEFLQALDSPKVLYGKVVALTDTTEYPLVYELKDIVVSTDCEFNYGSRRLLDALESDNYTDSISHYSWGILLLILGEGIGLGLLFGVLPIQRIKSNE